MEIHAVFTVFLSSLRLHPNVLNAVSDRYKFATRASKMTHFFNIPRIPSIYPLKVPYEFVLLVRRKKKKSF